MQDNLKSPSAKRALTEQEWGCIVASDHIPASSSLDMSARLRSVAARVRKNVTEGYATAPSFSKSHSTGTIFCSANDTIRDIFPSAVPQASIETPAISTRKRTRSCSDRDSDRETAEDDENDSMSLCEDQHIGTFALPTNVTALGRPIKPLRRKGMMMVTRSLPSGSMRHLEGNTASDATMNEEEDWSLSGDTASFEPMVVA